MFKSLAGPYRHYYRLYVSVFGVLIVAFIIGDLMALDVQILGRSFLLAQAVALSLYLIGDYFIFRTGSAFWCRSDGKGTKFDIAATFIATSAFLCGSIANEIMLSSHDSAFLKGLAYMGNGILTIIGLVLALAILWVVGSKYNKLRHEAPQGSGHLIGSLTHFVWPLTFYWLLKDTRLDAKAKADHP